MPLHNASIISPSTLASKAAVFSRANSEAAVAVEVPAGSSARAIWGCGWWVEVRGCVFWGGGGGVVGGWRGGKVGSSSHTTASNTGLHQTKHLPVPARPPARPPGCSAPPPWTWMHCPAKSWRLQPQRRWR